MSTLRENKLVWEETDKHGTVRLRFAKPPPNEHLLKLARAPLLEGEALRRALKKSDNKRAHDASATVFFLPKDHNLQKPYIDHTPREWKRVAIAPSGALFQLVTAGSHCRFLPGARAHYKFPPELLTEGLTLEQAVVNGKMIERLISGYASGAGK